MHYKQVDSWNFVVDDLDDGVGRHAITMADSQMLTSVRLMVLKKVLCSSSFFIGRHLIDNLIALDQVSDNDSKRCE